MLYVAGVLAAAALLFFAVHSYRYRFVRTNPELLGLLPAGDVTTFFADVGALRNAGVLQLLSGSKPAGDAEYEQFVRETQFDYTKDLEAVAGTADNRQLFFVALGRFDWNKLRQYGAAHGGNCRREICSLPASSPGRWISYVPIQPDVLGVALSQDDSAADQLRPDHPQPAERIPSTQPIWVKMSHSMLENPLSLPLAMRIFAVSLQSAHPVIFSIGRAPDNSKAAFDVQLDAQCPNEATAESTRNQLEIQTKMLSLELAREHQRPNPGDLTGLLTAGSFQVVEKRVVGTWPVSKELLHTLQ